MMQLHTLQRDFQQALLANRPPPAGLLNGRSVAQWQVYQNAYSARLRAALRDNYAVLPRVMGDDAFDALADAYIAAHPSRHYSLRWFGHSLCDFMASHATLVEHPATVDLARMEWAMRAAFDGPSAAPLTYDALKAVPAQDWHGLRLALHPCVHVLRLQWAVGPTWHALQSDDAAVEPPEPLDHVMLIWRLDLKTQWKSLTPAQADFVRGLQAGQSFGELCAMFAVQGQETRAASTVVACLRELLALGAMAAHSAAAA